MGPNVRAALEYIVYSAIGAVVAGFLVVQTALAGFEPVSLFLSWASGALAAFAFCEWRDARFHDELIRRTMADWTKQAANVGYYDKETHGGFRRPPNREVP